MQNACCEFLQTLIMYHFKTRTKSINCCKMGLYKSKSTHCTHIFHSRLHKLPYYKPKPTGVSNIFQRNKYHFYLKAHCNASQSCHCGGEPGPPFMYKTGLWQRQLCCVLWDLLDSSRNLNPAAFQTYQLLITQPWQFELSPDAQTLPFSPVDARNICCQRFPVAKKVASTVTTRNWRADLTS